VLLVLVKKVLSWRCREEALGSVLARTEREWGFHMSRRSVQIARCKRRLSSRQRNKGASLKWPLKVFAEADTHGVGGGGGGGGGGGVLVGGVCLLGQVGIWGALVVLGGGGGWGCRGGMFRLVIVAWGVGVWSLIFGGGVVCLGGGGCGACWGWVRGGGGECGSLCYSWGG